MINIITKNIDLSPGSTKLNQVIEAFRNAINKGEFNVGDNLPSVNKLSQELSVSRDTIFKAYSELKRRGLIDSTPAKGYFVADSTNSVFLFLDSYSPFKDILYNSLIDNLSKSYQVDLAFHHYNLRTFETLILNSIGKYSSYVIMNFNNEKISDVLQKIDSSKLLILDWGKYKDEKYSYVCQDFGLNAYKCLKEATPLLEKYDEFHYFYPKSSVHPETTWDYFKKYCEETNIRYSQIKNFNEKYISKGKAFITFQQKDLVGILKIAKEKKLKVGRDIGILAYNDTPLYEVIEDGITTISTDFKLMGKEAAEFIKTKEKLQLIIDTKLTVRNSL